MRFLLLLTAIVLPVRFAGAEAAALILDPAPAAEALAPGENPNPLFLSAVPAGSGGIRVAGILRGVTSGSLFVLEYDAAGNLLDSSRLGTAGQTFQAVSPDGRRVGGTQAGSTRQWLLDGTSLTDAGAIGAPGSFIAISNSGGSLLTSGFAATRVVSPSGSVLLLPLPPDATFTIPSGLACTPTGFPVAGNISLPFSDYPDQPEVGMIWPAPGEEPVEAQSFGAPEPIFNVSAVAPDGRRFVVSFGANSFSERWHDGAVLEAGIITPITTWDGSDPWAAEIRQIRESIALGQRESEPALALRTGPREWRTAPLAELMDAGLPGDPVGRPGETIGGWGLVMPKPISNTTQGLAVTEDAVVVLVQDTVVRVPREALPLAEQPGGMEGFALKGQGAE